MIVEIGGLVLLAAGRIVEALGRIKRDDLSPPKKSAWSGSYEQHPHHGS